MGRGGCGSVAPAQQSVAAASIDANTGETPPAARRDPKGAAPEQGHPVLDEAPAAGDRAWRESRQNSETVHWLLNSRHFLGKPVTGRICIDNVA
jgi:hypothetical protein